LRQDAKISVGVSSFFNIGVKKILNRFHRGCIWSGTECVEKADLALTVARLRPMFVIKDNDSDPEGAA